MHNAGQAVGRGRIRQAAGATALRALAGFVGALRVKYHDIELPDSGTRANADNGDLEIDLQSLFEAVGAAARADGTCIALFIDELQYVKVNELAALITPLHRMAQRQSLSLWLGRACPRCGDAWGMRNPTPSGFLISPEIGPLSPKDAKLAIAKPAADEGVTIEEPALDAIVARTGCYPYFLQEWGKHLWDAAESSPITIASVETASAQAIADLDASFFMVRFDRLTHSEKIYLRAMASLGDGIHRSGDIAQAMGRSVSSLAPTRSSSSTRAWSGVRAMEIPPSPSLCSTSSCGASCRRNGSSMALNRSGAVHL